MTLSDNAPVALACGGFALGILALILSSLREAAAMWQQVTDAVGADGRDALWSHPDVVPSAEDITDPSALVARITAGEPEPDDIDKALEGLLNDDTDDRPHEE